MISLVISCVISVDKYRASLSFMSRCRCIIPYILTSSSKQDLIIPLGVLQSRHNNISDLLLILLLLYSSYDVSFVFVLFNFCLSCHPQSMLLKFHMQCKIDYRVVLWDF